MLQGDIAETISSAPYLVSMFLRMSVRSHIISASYRALDSLRCPIPSPRLPLKDGEVGREGNRSKPQEGKRKADREGRKKVEKKGTRKGKRRKCAVGISTNFRPCILPGPFVPASYPIHIAWPVNADKTIHILQKNSRLVSALNKQTMDAYAKRQFTQLEHIG